MLNGNFIIMVLSILSFACGYAFGVLNHEKGITNHLRNYKIFICGLILVFVLFALEVI